MSDSMICANGHEVSQGAGFCKECGVSVAPEVSEPTTEYDNGLNQNTPDGWTVSAPENPKPILKEKTPTKSKVPIIGALAGLALIGGVAGAVMHGRGGDADTIVATPAITPASQEQHLPTPSQSRNTYQSQVPEVAKELSEVQTVVPVVDKGTFEARLLQDSARADLMYGAAVVVLWPLESPTIQEHATDDEIWAALQKSEIDNNYGSLLVDTTRFERLSISPHPYQIIVATSFVDLDSAQGYCNSAHLKSENCRPAMLAELDGTPCNLDNLVGQWNPSSYGTAWTFSASSGQRLFSGIDDLDSYKSAGEGDLMLHDTTASLLHGYTSSRHFDCQILNNSLFVRERSGGFGEREWTKFDKDLTPGGLDRPLVEQTPSNTSGSNASPHPAETGTPAGENPEFKYNDELPVADLRGRLQEQLDIGATHISQFANPIVISLSTMNPDNDGYEKISEVFDELQTKYGAILIDPTIYIESNLEGEWYMAILDQGFPDKSSAQQWCTGQGLTIDDCHPVTRAGYAR